MWKAHITCALSPPAVSHSRLLTRVSFFLALSWCVLCIYILHICIVSSSSSYKFFRKKNHKFFSSTQISIQYNTEKISSSFAARFLISWKFNIWMEFWDSVFFSYVWFFRMRRAERRRKKPSRTRRFKNSIGTNITRRYSNHHEDIACNQINMNTHTNTNALIILNFVIFIHQYSVIIIIIIITSVMEKCVFYFFVVLLIDIESVLVVTAIVFAKLYELNLYKLFTYVCFRER